MVNGSLDNDAKAVFTSSIENKFLLNYLNDNDLIYTKFKKLYFRYLSEDNRDFFGENIDDPLRPENVVHGRNRAHRGKHKWKNNLSKGEIFIFKY